MKRRHFGLACVALLTAAQARAARAGSPSLSARLAQWRRKILRSHVGLLLLGALAIGIPVALRPRLRRREEPPPWERDPPP